MTYQFEDDDYRGWYHACYIKRGRANYYRFTLSGIALERGPQSTTNTCIAMVMVTHPFPPLDVPIITQDHYDYGLRNLKAVLNMAGALKRADPNMNEEAILMRALR